jgi:hypothetical protein
MDGFRVDPEFLRAHGARVGVLSGEAGLAANAVSSVGLGDGAFGVLCSFMVVPLSVMDVPATAMCRRVQGVLEQSAGGLRMLADEFESADIAAAKKFDEVRVGLDSFVTY